MTDIVTSTSHTTHTSLTGSRVMSYGTTSAFRSAKPSFEGCVAVLTHLIEVDYHHSHLLLSYYTYFTNWQSCDVLRHKECLQVSQPSLKRYMAVLTRLIEVNYQMTDRVTSTSHTTHTPPTLHTLSYLAVVWCFLSYASGQPTLSERVSYLY